MNIVELKEYWLNGSPECHHQIDQHNFIRYAVELAKENGVLDFIEMERAGISPDRIREYQRLYEFLRDVLEVLGMTEA